MMMQISLERGLVGNHLSVEYYFFQLTKRRWKLKHATGAQPMTP